MLAGFGASLLNQAAGFGAVARVLCLQHVAERLGGFAALFVGVARIDIFGFGVFHCVIAFSNALRIIFRAFLTASGLYASLPSWSSTKGSAINKASSKSGAADISAAFCAPISKVHAVGVGLVYCLRVGFGDVGFFSWCRILFCFLIVKLPSKYDILPFIGHLGVKLCNTLDGHRVQVPDWCGAPAGTHLVAKVVLEDSLGWHVRFGIPKIG